MLTVVLKATRGNPQVKVPAPSLETGSYPKDSRRHGQPAPIVAGPASPAPPDQPSRPQTAPRSGSDPRQTTTRSPAPNSQGCATAAAIELRRWLRYPVAPATLTWAVRGSNPGRTRIKV